MTEEETNKKEHVRICKYCKQPYKTQLGLGNWKNLFRAPSVDEWITLFIIIMIIAAAFAYSTETKLCKETLNNIDAVCAKIREGNVSNPAVYNNPAGLLVIQNSP